MPSSIMGAFNGTITETADVLIPFFGDNFDITNESWVVELCEQLNGVVEERCIVRIAHEFEDAAAPAVAFNPDGPLSYIVHDCFIAVKKRYLDENGDVQYDFVFMGTVHDIRMEPANDTIVVTCKSVKEKLRDVKIVGSWCWDGDKVVYKRGIDLSLNPGGRPAWTFTPNGTPLMAPNADWGLGNDGSQTPPDPYTGEVQDAACNCELFMILEYLRVFHGPLGPEQEDPDVAEAWAYWTEQYPDLITFRAPDYVVWPPGFGSNVDAEFIANFDQGVGQNYTLLGAARKGRDMEFAGGISLIGDADGNPGVLDLLFQAAGAWSYQFVPYNDEVNGFEVILQEKPTRPSASQDMLPLYYAHGPALPGVPLVNFERPTDFYEEKSGAVVTRQLILGARVKNENLFNNLNPQWTDDDFDSFRTQVSILSGGSGAVPTEKAVLQALAQFPAIGSRFRIDPTNDPAIATLFSGLKYATQSRPIMPHCLTFQGGTGTNDIVYLPVLVEIQLANLSWVQAPEALGMVTWENGIIEFLTFRQIGFNVKDEVDVAAGAQALYGPLQYNFDTNGLLTQTAGMLDVSVRPIRLTAAIALDQLIEHGLISPSDNSEIATYQVDTQSWDGARFRDGFTRPSVTDAKSLYQYWNRTSTATPIPVSSGGTAPGLTILRDDSPLMVNHNRKNMRMNDRLRRGGCFPIPGFLTGSYPVGSIIGPFAPIDGFCSPFQLNAVVCGRIWVTEKVSDEPIKYRNTTELYLQ